jgi:hypothetical protein
MVAGTSYNRAAGGTGGAGSSGDINAYGNSGQEGYHVAGTDTRPGSGGGSAFYGGGAYVSSGNNQAGIAGFAYGGGAAGANTVNNATDRAGAIGATGVVIVYEYY